MKRKGDFITFHTGLYGDRAWRLLRALSECQYCEIGDNIRYSDVFRAPGDEVCMKTMSVFDEDFWKGGAEDGKTLADNLRGRAKWYRSEKYPIDPTSSSPCKLSRTDGGAWLKAPARVVFCAADFLDGMPAEELCGKYGRKFVDGLIGRPADPFRTTRESMRREAVADAEKSFNAEYEKVKAEMNRKIEEAEQARRRALDACRERYVKTLDGIAAEYGEGNCDIAKNESRPED